MLCHLVFRLSDVKRAKWLYFQRQAASKNRNLNMMENLVSMEIMCCIARKVKLYLQIIKLKVADLSYRLRVYDLDLTFNSQGMYFQVQPNGVL